MPFIKRLGFFKAGCGANGVGVERQKRRKLRSNA